MSNPLSADPECAQLATLIIKQAGLENCGFSKRHIRNLRSTPRGTELWNTLAAARGGVESVALKGKFDFSKFCREAVGPEFMATRACFKSAKAEYPSEDPRELCFGEILDLCKKIEFTWTDTVFRANEKRRM